jgi:hypothetical protein
MNPLRKVFDILETLQEGKQENAIELLDDPGSVF